IASAQMFQIAFNEALAPYQVKFLPGQSLLKMVRKSPLYQAFCGDRKPICTRPCSRPPRPPLSSRERLLLAAADELVDARKLTSATTAALRRNLVPAEIVELIALVGRYMWVSMIANTAALPRESGVRPWMRSIN